MPCHFVAKCILMAALLGLVPLINAKGQYIIESGLQSQNSIMRSMFENGDLQKLVLTSDSISKCDDLPLNERLLAIHFKDMALMAMGNYQECLNVLKSSLAIEKPDSLIYWNVQCLLGMHDIYSNLGAEEDAVNTLEMASRIIKSSKWKAVSKENDDHMRFSLAMSMSLRYQKKENWNKAIEELQKYQPRHLSESLNLMWTGQMAILYYKTGKNKEAEEWFKKALKIPVRNPNKLVVITYYAELLNMEERFAESISLTDDYENLAKTTKEPAPLRDFMMVRAHAYNGLGREKEAITLYNDVLQADDSLRKMQNKAMAYLIEGRVSQEKVEELNKDLGSMKKSVIVGIIVIILIVFITVIILWISIKNKRSSSKKISNLMTAIDRSDADYKAKMELLEKEIEDHNVKLQTSVVQLSKLDSGIRIIKEELSSPDKTNEERLAAIRYNLVEVGRESDNAEKYNIIATKESKNLIEKLTNLHPSLTKSELEMCCYINKGLSTRDIASISRRSVRTIEAIKYSLRKKLEISEPTDAYIRTVACDIQNYVN